MGRLPLNTKVFDMGGMGRQLATWWLEAGRRTRLTKLSGRQAQSSPYSPTRRRDKAHTWSMKNEFLLMNLVMNGSELSQDLQDKEPRSAWPKV